MNLPRHGALLPFCGLVLGLAASAPAQLRINELFLNPPGPNAGKQIIEIVNTSEMPFTPPADWTWCIRPAYAPIPQIEVPAGGVVQLHIGAFGTNTETDWFLPSVVELPLNGEFAIYSTNFFWAFPMFIEDFVSWGIGACVPFCTRIDIAVLAGKWPDLTTHLPVPAEGSSIASLGNGAGLDKFFVDSSPTLGNANEVAQFEVFGVGCQAMGSVPVLNIASGQLPWVAESFTLQLSGLPPAAIPFGVLGLSNTVWGPFNLPQDLGNFGFPGCTQFVSIDHSQPLANNAGTASWTIPVPLDPSLSGLEFFSQGVVLSGFQGSVSNAVRGVLGGVR